MNKKTVFKLSAAAICVLLSACMLFACGKKQKDFENIETRLNEFISDKKVIEIKSYVTEASFSEPKITFVVYYSE